jgi:hypothetical protein
MLSSILEILFGCAHRTTTFPLTPKRKRDTYVACLDCGKEFRYDWTAMRIGQPVSAPRATMIPATK